MKTLTQEEFPFEDNKSWRKNRVRTNVVDYCEQESCNRFLFPSVSPTREEETPFLESDINHCVFREKKFGGKQ